MVPPQGVFTHFLHEHSETAMQEFYKLFEIASFAFPMHKLL